MHKSSKCLEKYAGVILFRPEYAGVSSGVEKIAPDFCRSKKIYSGRNSVWSPLATTRFIPKYSARARPDCLNSS